MQTSYFRALRVSLLLAIVVFCATALTTPAATAQTPQPAVSLDKLDVRKNGFVNANDALHVIMAWTSLQRDGLCISPTFAQYDVDGSGCVDAVDAQLVATQLGGIADPNAPQVRGVTAGETTYTVNSTGNSSDSNLGDGRCDTGGTVNIGNGPVTECTLRAAIQQSNAVKGREVIEFNIRNSNGSCPSVARIEPPEYPLQSGQENQSWFIIDGDGVEINGYSQCEASVNTKNIAGDAKIKVEIKGKFQKEVHGIRVESSYNTIKGISIYNWDRQIEISGSTTLFNKIQGNFIGTDSAQGFESGGLGTHHSEGIRVQYGPMYNVIGCGSFNGTTFVPCTNQSEINAARNIVAGNGNDGIHLETNTVKYNHIVGNYIGLKQDGTSRRRNASDGIDFELGVQYNWLGGLTPGERNVISGNGSEGIEISHSTETQFNHIVGNYFGLDATGKKLLYNSANGVSFEDTVDSNYVYDNYISGNKGNGVRFYVLATRNLVRNNKIGVDVDGKSMPNGQDTSDRYGRSGVYVMGGSQHNMILENEIAYNPAHGVFLSTTSDEDHDGYGATFYNTISKNSTHDNGGRAISLAEGSDPKGSNQGIKKPVLTSASTRSVSGTTCPNCTIEVFIADANTQGNDNPPAGEGETFIGSGVADAAGNFTVQTTETKLGTKVTATTTDPAGNTSMFSVNIPVTIDIGATETAIAATAAVQTATAAVEQTATAAAEQATATALAATAQAEATQTAIVLQTEPALAATATAEAAAATAQAATAAAQTAVAQTATAISQAPNNHTVALPLMER